MTDVIQIHTTVDSEAQAQQIADLLVQKNLAACVQIGGPLRSRYRWQGNIEESTEWMCTAKTAASLYESAEAAIRSVHSYDEPEIIATPVVAGSAGYLDWVRNSVMSD